MWRDINIAVAATDHRAVEVLASDLPLHHGVQLAMDIIRCARTAESRACPNAATTNGAVLQAAREEKATKYASVETGGRWSDEAMQIAELAVCKAREATALDEDDRHFLRTGSRSFTGLVEREHSRV